MGDVGVVHRRVGGRAGRSHDPPDGQPELAGEGEVTLVVGGHGHDRAGAVAGQHVVGDVDRDALAVDRVDGVGPDGHAGLLAVGRQPVDLGPPPGLLDVGIDLGPALRRGQLGDQRVLGGEDHERGPEQRVRTGREHAQRGAARVMLGRRGREVDLGALGAADPVGLLDADGLRPVQAGEVQQLVGELGRAQVPLLQVALLDQRAAAPAVAIDALDLLAGQRAVVGAPVDRRLLAVGQAGLQEAQEQPLVPAVEVGVGRDHLVVPAEGGAHGPELAAHLVDVLHRPRERVATVLDGRVLGRQPEGIEADGEEHVQAVHPPEAGQGIGRGHDVPVADVQVARRVRVHRQQVMPRLARVGEVRVVEARIGPALLPGGLDRRRVVALDAAAGVGVVDGLDGLGHGGGLWIRFTPRRRRGVKVGGVAVDLVELRGLEPRTSCMPCTRSSS